MESTDSIAGLDAGRAGIDWNGILGGLASTASQIAVAKATRPDTTPVPATSPVQTGTDGDMTTVGGVPVMWIGLAAVAVVGLFLVLRK